MLLYCSVVGIVILKYLQEGMHPFLGIIDCDPIVIHNFYDKWP